MSGSRMEARPDLPEPEVDGPLMLGRAVGFARALNAAGIRTDPGSAIDFARALLLVDLSDRAGVKAAGATLFVRRRDDLPVYEEVFERFWRRRGFRVPATSFPQPPEPTVSTDPPEEQGHDAERQASERIAAPTGETQPSGEDDDSEIEGVMRSPEARSHGELINHKEFDRMTPAELREAERLIDVLAPRLETRPTRRYELHRHGRRLAPRVMFRRNLGTGGDPVEWVWRRTVREPRSIVVLCDISGSMERQSRLLLRFVLALASASDVRTEAFVFGTRLTRVTRLLRDRDRDRALARVSEAVVDWAGGTRIGESFREFNQRWARRVLRTSAIVIVVSDGWDSGDPALLAQETARLRRNCHRLIWLNPLASAAGYRPLATGMAAAYPHLDDFVAAGTVASLVRLGELLAGLEDPRSDLAAEGGGGALGVRGGPRVWRPRGLPPLALPEYHGAGYAAAGGRLPAVLGGPGTPPDAAAPLA